MSCPPIFDLKDRGLNTGEVSGKPTEMEYYSVRCKSLLSKHARSMIRMDRSLYYVCKQNRLITLKNCHQQKTKGLIWVSIFLFLGSGKQPLP